MNNELLFILAITIPAILAFIAHKKHWKIAEWF